MRDVTLRFITTLRAAGLRISLSESMDAIQALAAVGVGREVLREALAASLVKEEEDRPLFDEVFSHFFAAPGSRRKGKRQNQASGGAEQRVSGLESSGLSLGSGVQSPESEGTEQKLEQVQGKSRSVQNKTKQVQDSSGQVKERQDKSRVSSSESQSVIRSPANLWAGNPQSVIPPFPDLQSLPSSSQARLVKQQALLEKPFKTFDARDVEAVSEVVEELARQLRRRLSRRYKPRKRGRLDFRRTLRAALSHGGVPVDLLLRDRRPGKPDLVALCDLSGSVAMVSDFLLALLAPTSVYFRRVRTFAYVDRLCEVSFEHGHVIPHETLDLYASSDFGRVLQHFWQDYGEQVLTHNTLMLILGDARNNRRPPRVDLLTQIREHAQKLVWLNPEPGERWNTGDSVINRYAPVCDTVLECGNLRELLSALRQVLP